jgi:fascin 1
MFFFCSFRPILVLKCEQGFVGYKSASSNKLECNKATYETIMVERGDKGIVYFKGELIQSYRFILTEFSLCLS